MLTIGKGIRIGQRRLVKKAAVPPTPGESGYLLTAAGNRICTAAGTRIRLVTAS